MIKYQVKYCQEHLYMKEFERDDLEYKEIPSKPQEKDPTILIIRILHTFIGMDINIFIHLLFV